MAATEDMEWTNWLWWWWVLACMFGWGGSSFLMGWAGRNLPYSHSFFYNTIGMTVGVALVVMLMEDGMEGGHRTKDSHTNSAHPHRHGGGELRKRVVDSATKHDITMDFDGMLGWQDGSVAILSGIAAALADIAFYQLARMGMSVSVAGPVSGLYLTVPAVLGVVVLGEEFTWAKALGLVLAIAAIYLLSEGDDEGGDAHGEGDADLAEQGASSSGGVGSGGGGSKEQQMRLAATDAAPAVTRRREAVRTPHQVELATTHS